MIMLMMMTRAVMVAAYVHMCEFRRHADHHREVANQAKWRKNCDDDDDDHDDQDLMNLSQS